MRIADLLTRSGKESFVGRAYELGLLEALLNSDTASWKILNLYGPSGIGKSSLLQMFALQTGAERCIYLPRPDARVAPAHFADQLNRALLLAFPTAGYHPTHWTEEEYGQLANRLNLQALQSNGLIVLVDAFEQWTGIEQWFRDSWLPLLSPLVKWCLASRDPIGSAWRKEGWHSFVNRVELKPLQSDEVRQYLERSGIRHLPTIHKLHRMSGGIPLTLSTFSELIASRGADHHLLQQVSREIREALITDWLRAMSHPDCFELLDAACTVWRFDQELLEAIVQRPFSTESFRTFCNQPFVIRHRNYWRMHDLIRHWGREDLQRRKPAQYNAFRERAVDEIQRRKHLVTDSLLSDWMMDLIELYDHEFIQTLSHQYNEEIEMNHCSYSDLDRIEQLYLSYLGQRIEMGTDRHLLPYIRPLWQAQPSAFVGLWKGGTMVAFCTVLKLNESTVQILQQSPITAPLTRGYEKEGNLFAVPLAGMDMNMEYEISGSLAKALPILVNLNARMINILPFPDWDQFLQIIGYQRANWADGQSIDGHIYHGYEIDLQGENLKDRLNRLHADKLPASSMAVSPTTQSGIPNLYASQLTLEDIIPLLKRALKRFEHLPYEPGKHVEILAWIGSGSAEKHMENLALLLQRELTDVIAKMEGSTQEDCLHGKLLRLAYLNKIGSHALIAERLNLSLPTYYRYLQVAIRKLARLLKAAQTSRSGLPDAQSHSIE